MESQTKGVARQSLIIAAASFMLIAAAVGAGAFGGASVDDLQDGALSAQGSYLAPAGPAFSIWSLIYIGLLAYTVWQALPAQRADARQQAVGGWIAASMVLNGLWLVTARFLTLWLTVIVIALLLATLARIIVLLGRFPAKNLADRILTDGANGLHFGWVTIATVANTAAWLTQIAPAEWADQADVWAVAVLVVVAVIGVAAALVTRRIAPALATAWGLVWLAVGRFTDAPESVPTGIAALVVAVVLVLAGAIGVARRTSRR
ncbi:tryptophan-rich sensory protein [Microbacterium sp. SSW1-49]|uniref:Tryptophan-rich sensory protein n=1 Tax=Microbacterium croceum TaxID=2851645 RepID=A0ABT0FBE5_9MICO|nr:TspO/MBR family protein [Microbacterium croceum]MCK2035376.1 tryptophan-rich sensory protein [Microbacterium croceum]